MLSLSPLLFSLAAFVFAAPVVEALSPLRGLTSTDFSSTTSQGLWLVEFFSPSCPHCRRFEPTWRNLTEKYDPLEKTNDFHMAQNIRHYPDMKLYRNGKELETFEGERSMELLVTYIDSKIAEHTPSKVMNPEGKLLSLSQKTFSNVLEEGPVFVKFFAPWCGHCKKLAPVWAELASRMKGVMNIAEVNCDNNAALCRKEGIEGYPMLFIYDGGNKVEYRAPRKLEPMEAFARKATAPGIRALGKSDFIEMAKKESVVFVYIETAGAANDHSEKVQTAGKHLLGDPPLVKSSDDLLRTHLGQDEQHGPILAVVKQSEVTNTLPITTSTTVSDISQWLTENKLPTSAELNGQNFQTIMKGENGPYVVIAALDTDDALAERLVVEKAKLHGMARDWHKTGKKVNGRSVLFVWMDAKTWGKWLKSMYGIKAHNLPTVIVADHTQLTYYDVDTDKQPISFSATAVHGLLDDINAGAINAKSSENIVERTMRSAHNKVVIFEDFLKAHPLRAVGLVAVVLSLIIIAIWKLVQLDTSQPKHTRLD
ncbi:hypothetical protein FRB97_007106 [Tulasnella sp. 331]|nr:hypothetical protein FRB97_007106 [Tulasnella sp. 331]